ncbi:cytochrome c biogenesis heme-transporting ATPase CcmA [Gilvimarinus sp. 1_MG-2023]|uniref:cytochrome c biogenesis heme-transporting ATPase CcmA n=1 Tax=Gilvimarinus sp. 1_MG-2023 TaxID=3062638 RepID=UPI0026E1FB83|nr:cytochrome c biogenesis heme-transporting ATPase CcmA [Gilvimarinus sp. 1_MG-2023]MDO6745861.1 cytochrome c biogenesis heme-transporting ATPase CcmA [Gilvimarinus sp. 1_MG-2023]
MLASLSFNNISCERDERILFNNLSYECKSGTLLQVVGFNGAGKTTLLHTLCGLRQPATGQILWQAQDISLNPQLFKQSLFFLGHQTPVKGHLTVTENIQWLRSLHPVPSYTSIQQALIEVDLLAYADTHCHQLSAGQRRRVALSQLYLTQASLWVLDEPFTSIDKAGVAKLALRLQQHTERGGIVVLTSHQPVELEHLQSLDLSRYQPSLEEHIAHG